MTETTWAYRFRCPECGHESVTQDEDLRDEMTYQHERRVHDGRSVCEWDKVDDVPVDTFPKDETPVVEPPSSTSSDPVLGVESDA